MSFAAEPPPDTPAPPQPEAAPPLAQPEAAPPLAGVGAPPATALPTEAPSPPAMRATWSGLSVAVDGHWLFKDFTYAVPDGGIVGVVGPRGHALDVALLALVGRYPANSGNVAIIDAPASVVVGHLDTISWDDPLLTVNETVLEHAAANPEGTPAVNANRCIAAVGAQDIAHLPFGSLNAAARIRVSVAAAAANGANVLAFNFCDLAGEPEQESLWLLLTQLAGTGRLLFVASNQPNAAMNLTLTIPHALEVQ